MYASLCRCLPFILGGILYISCTLTIFADDPIVTILPTRVSQERVKPGETIKITFNFDAQKPYPIDNSIFVHIKDPTGMTIDQADHLPPIATSSPDWKGKISYARDYTFPADIEGITPRSGKYILVVGLYHKDGENWANEPVSAGEGAPLFENDKDRCVVGSFTVEAPAPANRPAITTVFPVQVSQEQVPPGARLKITYNFEAQKPCAIDNSVFVHIKDATGKTITQADHTPSIATASPGWIGKISYVEEYTVPVELSNKPFPEGKYTLVIGLYHKEWENWVNENLIASEGVQYLDNSKDACVVGSFIVNKNAPMPKPDTEKPPTLDLEGFKLVFEEDFSKPLDVSPWGSGTRWIAHTPWAGDFGDARFMDPKPDFPFTIKEDVLRIEARKSEDFIKDDQYKRPWAAGLLASCDPKGSGFGLQYGYFEARMKMPPGPGVWPAFWLASVYDRTDRNAGRDGSIEVDVVEYYGHFPSSYRTALHVWEPQPHRGAGASVTTLPNGPSTDFHNYGVLVEKENTTFFYDGVEVWKQATPVVHNKPLMLLVNLALGSGYSIENTPSPSYLYIEHIRAYALPER